MYNGPKVKIKEKEFRQDGNAFAIMGVVVNAMRSQLALPSEEINKIIQEYREKAMSGDYENLLAVSLDYAEIILNNGCDDDIYDDDYDDDDDYDYDYDDDVCYDCGYADCRCRE